MERIASFVVNKGDYTIKTMIDPSLEQYSRINIEQAVMTRMNEQLNQANGIASGLGRTQCNCSVCEAARRDSSTFLRNPIEESEME